MQKDPRLPLWVSLLRKRLPEDFFSTPPIGLILGTGLSTILEELHGTEIPFADLPGFPLCQSASHPGMFVAATLENRHVLIQAGRHHLYEGRTPQEICMGVCLMRELSITTLILTNASGSLNPLYAPGTLLLVTDQINLTGHSPLTGPNDDTLGLRFPDMSRTFDPTLQKIALEQARKLAIPLERGVYIGVHGPELETPAETRLYRMLGADCIGMSSVLEVICARYLGMRVLEISCLANQNLPDCMAEVALEEILCTVAQTNRTLFSLLKALAAHITNGYNALNAHN